MEEYGWTRTEVVVESPWEPRQTLFYRVRLPEGWRLTESSDPFVLVPLYKAMRVGGPVHVEGTISPSLLAEEPEGFAAAADKAEAMLADLDLPLVRMTTNVRRVEQMEVRQILDAAEKTGRRRA